MSNVINFENQQFGNVRIVVKDNEPWFVADDIAKSLKYRSANDLTRILEDEEKDTHNMRTLGGNQTVTIINESGLYSAILRSRKPEAKQFKKWVTAEVLPSIRKHGAYMTDKVIEDTLSNPDFIIKLATELKTEKSKRIEVEKQLNKQKPKVELYDEFMATDGLMNFKQVADCIGDIGRNNLFKELRSAKVLSDNPSNHNLPYAKYRKMFAVKITLRKTDDGMKEVCTTLCKPQALKLIKRILDKKRISA
jgi:anti-repressor protein